MHSTHLSPDPEIISTEMLIAYKIPPGEWGPWLDALLEIRGLKETSRKFVANNR